MRTQAISGRSKMISCWIVIEILLIAQRCFGEFQFDDGGVLGALRNKESGKCVNFYQLPTTSGETITTIRATRLETGCEKLFKLLPNGNIKEHDSENVCISESIDQLAAKDCPTNGDISFTTKGALSIPDPEAVAHSLPGYTCFFVYDLETAPIGLTYNSERNHCEGRENFFEFLAPGMSWQYDLEYSSIETHSDEDYCITYQKRMCTLIEVCPNGPGQQSVIGISGPDRVLFTINRQLLKADTCERDPAVPNQIEDKDGLLCCPMEYPRPRNPTRNGYGYLLHSSGKCVHWRSPRMVLKHECGGITGIVSLQEDGTLSFTNNVMAYSRFQFTDGNSLQDIINNNMCMVPTDNESLEPELAVRENQCGRPESTFVFQSKYKGCGDRIFPCEGLQGFLEHSDGRCLSVDGSELRLTPCSMPDTISPDNIFYKTSYDSPLYHAVSGKCIKKPQDGQVLQLTTACQTNGAQLRYDGAFRYGENKCLDTTGDGVLTFSSDCTSFQFVDARSECQGASCSCLDGYERKGRSCFPINPCHARDRGGCDTDAECIYTGPGTHVCLCPPGSRLAKDGVMCVECPDKNCYTNCEIVNDQEFIRAIQRQQNRVVLRFLHMVTSDLSLYIGEDSREIVIYAQEIIISGTLTLPTGLKIAIFARRVIKENGASIELTTDNSARTSAVNVEHGKLLCRNTFPGPEADPVVIKGATLNIYTGKSSLPFTCSGNYNVRNIAEQAAVQTTKNPKQALDVDFLSLTLSCAKVIAQDKTVFSKDNKLLMGSLPVQMAHYILKQVKEAKDVALSPAIKAVGVAAGDFLVNLNTLAQGVNTVPYLSLRAHEKILVLLKDDAKMAIDEYEKYRTTSLSITGRIEATKSMTNVMTVIVRRNDLDVEALENELKVAISERRKIEKKFDESKLGLDVAKATFERGVRDYKDKQIAGAVFSILGGITSMLAGGAGGVIGFAVELGELGATISKLSKIIFKIAIILDSISGIADAAVQFTAVHFDILPYAHAGVSDYYSKSLPEKDNSKSLAVLVKEWDVFEAEAEAFLGIGTAANDISGTSDYLAALKTLAVWGRALHEKSITVDEIMSTLVKLKTLKCEQHESQEQLTQSLQLAEDDNQMNSEVLINMALQKQRLRSIMVDNLISFCRSYFYNWLAECPITPMLSDDLYDLHEKINQGLTSVINTVENFAPYIPQDFEETKLIMDDVACQGTLERLDQARKQDSSGQLMPDEALPLNALACPIYELKRGKTFLYRPAKTDADIFKGYERVRVQEIEVYLEGATVDSGKDVTIFISFSGVMTDSFRGKEHKFVTAPRMTLFAYKTSNDGRTKITQPGKVSNAFQEYYDNIAALTTWTIQVPDEYNHRSLNLEGLMQVKLVIKGTRVPRPDASDFSESESESESGSGSNQKDGSASVPQPRRSKKYKVGTKSNDVKKLSDTTGQMSKLSEGIAFHDKNGNKRHKSAFLKHLFSKKHSKGS